MLWMRAQINLKHIEAFRSVMLAGSVVGAAKLLNVTQPGVSRTIGLLELRLGFALFVRQGRKLIPTPEAEALFREVEPLYSGVERIAQVAQDIRLRRTGALRVACLPALAQGLVPHAVAQLLDTRPNVTVFLQSLPSRQIADLVATYQFDIGVVELPLARQAIDFEPLPAAQVVVVLPPKHPLTRKKVISCKDLNDERMILLSQHSYLRYQIDDAFQSEGATANVLMETPSSSIACALVAAGAGITLVGRLTAAYFAQSEVVIRPLKTEVITRYALIYPQTASRSPLAEIFAALLKEQASSPSI